MPASGPWLISHAVPYVIVPGYWDIKLLLARWWAFPKARHSEACFRFKWSSYFPRKSLLFPVWGKQLAQVNARLQGVSRFSPTFRSRCKQTGKLEWIWFDWSHFAGVLLLFPNSALLKGWCVKGLQNRSQKVPLPFSSDCQVRNFSG